MRQLLWLSGILAVVVASAYPASAAIVTYRNRNLWNGAVGGEPTWLANFQEFKTDTPFTTSAVDCGPFSLVQIRPGDFRNLIDVKPFQFDDGPNSKHASMFTDFGQTSVQMTFDQPVYAWGANLYSVGPAEDLLPSEWINLDLVLDVGGVVATISPGRQTGFFGVVSTDPHMEIRSILFTSRDDLANGGEGFAMDNVVGATSVPEPSSLVVWSSLGVIGMAVAYRRRRRKAS